MTHEWIPTNRATARICAVLLRAHREGRIQLLAANEARCRSGVVLQHFHVPTRRIMGSLWLEYDGWRLATEANQIGRLPEHVLAELRNPPTIGATDVRM